MNRPMNRPCPQPRNTRPAYSCCPPPVVAMETIRELKDLPLAMAYVPIQMWGDVYTPCRALARGTLFPQLDLPFQGVGNAS